MSARVVTFHYTLLNPEGRVIDSSAGADPITYLEGAGQIIDGLDRRLRDVAPGARVKVPVPAAEAYGLPDPTQVQKVKRALLPVQGELRVGEQFQAGEDRFAPVVTLDANHPLAGVDLTFEIDLVSARPATAEELSHGHPHGADGTAPHP
jgi:FKBP-type peptidyl-prolyl cis-trans isomerase SlyD